MSVKPNARLASTYMRNWLTRSRLEKGEWNERQDRERCYRELLHDKISTKIEFAQKSIEEETRYKLEMRSSLSSLEVLVSHPDWQSEKFADLHFKLTACPNGIFLMYGARLKTRLDSLPPNPKVFYSQPEPINEKIKISTIIEWVGKAANTSIQSLRLTEYAAECRMKNCAGHAETPHCWRISLCCLLRRVMRALGFL